MIDPRYYYENVISLINSEGITDVLFLYSMNIFAEDTSLADVLNAAGGQPAEAPAAQENTEEEQTAEEQTLEEQPAEEQAYEEQVYEEQESGVDA